MPFDHDGALELVAIPEAKPRAPRRGEESAQALFVLAPDEQGFWRERPPRLSYTQWADELMLKLLAGDNEQLNFNALKVLKTYHAASGYAYREQVYEAASARYQSLNEPSVRAEFLAHMPVDSPETAHAICAPLLSEQAQALDIQMNCLTALSENPSEANRALISKAYPSYMLALRARPELYQYY